MADITILRRGRSAIIHGDTKEGKEWLVKNMCVDAEVSFRILEDLVKDFSENVEADGLSVEVK